MDLDEAASPSPSEESLYPQESIEPASQEESKTASIPVDDPQSITLSRITPNNRSSINDETQSLEALGPSGVRIEKSNFESFMHRESIETDKARKADMFIRRIRRDRQQFDGRMFLIKKKEEQERRRRDSMKEMDSSEKSLDQRKRKLGNIFQNLQEYEQRKKRRQEEITKFKQDLNRLRKQKALYQLKQEQFKLKHELPVILEREERLQEVKNSRKPFDWKKEMNAFQDRIYDMKRERSSRVHRSPEEAAEWGNDIYKSRFYKDIESRSSDKTASIDSKAVIHKRRKEYSREVKYYIEPHMVVRVRSNVDIDKPPSPKLKTKETQRVLGDQYLQYCKGFSSKKRYKTERPLKLSEGHTAADSTLQHHIDDQQTLSQQPSTLTLQAKPILSTEDEQQYISDIKIKLEMLRYISK